MENMVMVNTSKKMKRIVQALRKQGRKYYWDKFYANVLNIYIVWYEVQYGIRSR